MQNEADTTRLVPWLLIGAVAGLVLGVIVAFIHPVRYGPLLSAWMATWVGASVGLAVDILRWQSLRWIVRILAVSAVAGLWFISTEYGPLPRMLFFWLVWSYSRLS